MMGHTNIYIYHLFVLIGYSSFIRFIISIYILVFLFLNQKHYINTLIMHVALIYEYLVEPIMVYYIYTYIRPLVIVVQ